MLRARRLIEGTSRIGAAVKLDEIEKMIEAASPAPWPTEFGRSDFPDEGSMACGPIITSDEDAEEKQAQDDQDFICMARELMPKLLKLAHTSISLDLLFYSGSAVGMSHQLDAWRKAMSELEQP